MDKLPRYTAGVNGSSDIDLLSRYCNCGLPLIPLHDVQGGACSCGSAGCNPGKHPRIGNEWQEKATSDLDTVLGWVARWPSCNWGVLTGSRSGVFMIGPDGEQGLKDMAGLARELGDLAPCPWQWSGTSPGYHLVLAWPDDRLPISNRTNHRGLAIDVRGENGQFVVEPSRNLKGPYRWDVPPWELAPPPCPAPWLEWIRGDGKERARSLPSAPPVRRAYSAGRPGVRDRARRYLERVDGAVSGQGGHAKTLWAARCLVWGFCLDPDDALDVLLADYNPRCRPEWSERELRHKVLQADVVPFGKPRGWLRDEERPMTRQTGTPTPSANGQPEGKQQANQGPARILISTVEKEVNDQAIAALARRSDLYQRAGMLVRLVRDGASTPHIRRAEGASRILAVSKATLREEMAHAAHWRQISKGKEGPAHPPTWAIDAVHQRGAWSGIRYLAGVVEAPTLRPDGTVLDTPGYDPHTGLIYQPSADYPPLSPHPTHDDARRAAEDLLGLVDDFPFPSPDHAAAWLSAILTVLARPAIAGPCPLFLFEAPTPGSGKTLLAELVGLITTGRETTVSALADDNDEVRKTITAILLEGERLVLFDNASGSFGCRALDAPLTGTTYKDRILGRTERTPEVRIDTVFLATGNNLRLQGDTPRRIIPCRIVPDCERPEEREGFRIPDLKGHVRRHRPALVVAALTILRAHALAGRPSHTLPVFGTFDAWTAVVRQAIVWATGHDPHAARDVLMPESRGATETLAAVLEAWSGLPGGQRAGDGVTARRALELASTCAEHSDLRDALAEWGKGGELPDANMLGYRLRAAKDRVAGGWVLRGRSSEKTAAKWWVEPVQPTRGDRGDAGGCFRPVRRRAPVSLPACQRTSDMTRGAQQQVEAGDKARRRKR